MHYRVHENRANVDQVVLVGSVPSIFQLTEILICRMQQITLGVAHARIWFLHGYRRYDPQTHGSFERDFVLRHAEIGRWSRD
jgi:hypothetical protein